MQFLAPLALLAGFLALAILAFHIRRRRTLTVPSLVIWRRLQSGQVRRNRTWQWPTPSWSLALQLLALVAMVLALAMPVLNRSAPVDHWVFVLDRSGAMQATAGGSTLLDEAKQQLAARLANAVGNGRQSVLSIGSTVAPMAVDQTLGAPGVLSALAAIEPEDAPADWTRLDAALASIARPNENTRVVVYSDHAVQLPNASDRLAVEPVVLTSDTPNAAISADLVASTKAENRWLLSGTVRLDPGKVSTDVIIGYATTPSEQPLEWTRRTIGNPDAAPTDEASQSSFSVTLDLPGPGIVSVGLAEDGNGYDNSMRFVIDNAPASLDILYVGNGNQPLLSALRAIDGTQIFQAPRLPSDLGQYGLVVVDNQVVDRQPETNTLWIGDTGIGAAGFAAGTAQPPTAAQEAHPLIRGVDWTGIETGGSLALPAMDQADILLRSGDSALVTAEKTDFGRDIHLAFDPRKSNWAQQPSFPVFVSNIVNWLGIAPHAQLRAPCVVAARCVLDRRLEGGSVTHFGSGAENPAPLTAAGWVPERAGLYQVQRGSLTTLIAVNPALAQQPIETAELAAPPGDFPLPLWPFLLSLAALALVAEAIVSGRGAERFLQREGLRSSNPLSRRRRTALALHVVTLALVIAAFANAPLPWRQSGEVLVQVTAAGSPALPDTDGRIAAAPMPRTALTDVVDRTGSTRDAIALAAATIPWDQPGHIVVTGDTASDDDEFGALPQALRQRGIILDRIAPSAVDDTIAVTALEAPVPVFVGDTIQLVGVVHASAPTQATLRFERDGDTLVEQPVALAQGDNRVETILNDLAEGSATYTLTVASSADTTPDNNSLSHVIDTRDAGQIAVIANDPARGDAFIRWLDSQGIAGTAVEPKRVPYRPDDWKTYDGAVLLDVPAITLTTLQQEQLETAVAEQGLGLLILGGPNSFGPGGYLQTPLDDASPLSSRIPRDAPEATLVFVLDRSGSMQQPVGNGTRLDVAKQATLAAVRLLNRNSQVGIIVFDSEPITVLPLARIDNPDVVSTALSGVDPGGGTSVYPGLEAAYEMLRNVDTPARHIIVMTDGLSQPANFPGLLNRIRSAGITVSSVSIGEGAERGLIEQIARLGGGTFHATDDFAALPSILSQEAMLLSGSPVETGITQPLWASRSEPFLRGLPATMPPIDGFVLTTAKPEAQLSMVVPDSKGEPMPLMASWRFGAGQVMALTTEAVGPWSAQWQSMPSYPPFWAQVVRQFLPGVERGNLVLDLARRGDGVVAEVTARAADGGAPTLSVVDASGQITVVPLERTGLDTYEAAYYPPAAGNYRFEALGSDQASVARTIAVGYPARMAPAFADEALARLATATGGQADAIAATRRDVPDRWTTLPAGPFWIALAILAFMAALTIRYTRLLAPRPVPMTPPRPQPPQPARSDASEPVHA